jgi:hypothetical protein
MVIVEREPQRFWPRVIAIAAARSSFTRDDAERLSSEMIVPVVG